MTVLPAQRSWHCGGRRSADLHPVVYYAGASSVGADRYGDVKPVAIG